MSLVTKFVYLKEFEQPKVGKGIDRLSFSAEGYNRV